MMPNKILVKIPTTSADGSWLQDSLEIFHRWISERALNEILIDVADYRHVHQGTRIALVGHECHYYVDETGGRLGLCCFRKRGFTEGRDPLLDALHRALLVCELLQRDLKRDEPLFDTGVLEVRIADRRFTDHLSLSNDALGAATSERLRPIYEGTPVVESLEAGSLPGVRLSFGEARPLQRLRQSVERALEQTTAAQPAVSPAE